MDDFNLDIHTFAGKSEGKTLTVLGAVHGNEHCGPQAINKLINLIKSGNIKITSGTLTVIPVCNPRAYKQNVRFTERNLNRFMYPKDNPVHYEDHLDNIICPVLDKTDYLLDLHSYSCQGDAFVFLSVMNQANIDFAKSLDVPRFIFGWGEAMKSNEDLVDKRQANGTTEYAREHGGVAVTLECGHHGNENNADVAFNAILGALKHLNIAEYSDNLLINGLPKDQKYNIRMKGAFLKLKQGDFVKKWKNMDFVKAGTVVARYDDGEELVMPADSYIVLPMYDPTIGDQWFFWGVEDPLGSEIN
jgi:predicted deacylase